MVKSEFIASLAVTLEGQTEAYLPPEQVAMCVYQLLRGLTGALVEGQRIEIRGFGAFSVRQRAPRQAHNPKTGEKVTTEMTYKIHFKPGKAVKARMNSE